MSAEDWIDLEYYDDEWFSLSEPPPKRCQRCGADDLEWRKAGSTWRLHDWRGRLHVCPDLPHGFVNLDEPTARVVLATLPVQDQCLVHRVLYYCLARPILTDHEYDMLEREATLAAPPSHLIQRPGSDTESTYPPHLVQLAYRLAFPELD